MCRLILEARRRSPHGERGLKREVELEDVSDMRRSPHGERGLKLQTAGLLRHAMPVAPRTGSVD